MPVDRWLTREPDRAQSAIAADAFQAFLATLEGTTAAIIERTSTQRSQQCREFGFAGMPARLLMVDLAISTVAVAPTPKQSTA
jgi:hypothetical protein